MIEPTPAQQARLDELQECCDRWNAKERARAYREKNREKLAAQAKERRERERLEQIAAREAIFGRPPNAADYPDVGL